MQPSDNGYPTEWACDSLTFTSVLVAMMILYLLVMHKS